MSSPIWQSVNHQIVALTISLAMVVSTIFYAYYKDKLSEFGLSMITNISTVNGKNPQAEKEIIILIWMWAWNRRFPLTCAPYNITGCFLTDNKAMYSKADAVMIHHLSIRDNLTQVPQAPRPHYQFWVWYNMESQTLSWTYPGLNDLFNLTCNHRRDSDIFTPYGSIVPVSKEDGPFTVPLKQKLVCWMVSNFNPSYQRFSYYDELKKHINIETWGRAYGERISESKYEEIVKTCKFYLSFENSIHTDYITEKFFRPLELGTVPVVFGPPRENYESHAPGSSFIHVDDFDSPKELADKLKHLDQHQDEYMAYFEWRNHYKSVTWKFGQDNACNTCQYLKTHKRYQNFRNLNKWYWG